VATSIQNSRWLVCQPGFLRCTDGPVRIRTRWSAPGVLLERFLRTEGSRFEPLNERGNGIAGFPTGEPADWKVGVTEESFMESGHVMHVTFTILDFPENREKANDTHGSHCIVVPFGRPNLNRQRARQDVEHRWVVFRFGSRRELPDTQS
jgi:hypothetical protein